MKILTMYRHAESEANIGGISRPNAEIEITESGRLHAEQVAEKIINKPSKIYISEFIRTEQSAQPLLDKFNIKPIKYAGLNEFNTFGYETVKGLNGQQRAPLTLNYWKTSDPNKRIGDTGETFNEFSQRVKNFIPTLKTFEDKSIIFGHGMWMTYFIWLTISKSHGFTDDQIMRYFMYFHRSLNMKNLEKIDILVNEDEIFIKRGN